ncbi:hypothetical protein POM88_002710 [Heracleum sosnowskyi]|uniref:Transposase (putative) gypsy type domain-containing protein n=1 Tax=Heracleum sosnowskyi TaxID=360622 RepID=A0AAD8JIZ5_9APIA|nr:hypothetical protein POM88_002710 [Heracleum sosnowskyi]
MTVKPIFVFLMKCVYLEGKGASSPFHPFKDFNKRLGIYSPPSISFPAQSSSSIRSFHTQAIEQLREASPFKGDTEIMSSPLTSNSSLPHVDDLNLEVTSHHSRTRPQQFKPVIDEGNDVIEDTEATIFRQKREKQIESSNSEGASDSETESNCEDASSDSPYPHIDEDDRTFPPESSPIPFIHPEIAEEEIDLDWGQYKDTLSEAEKRRLRKQNNKLFCVAMSSTVSVEEITWSMTYYQMEGKWARPPSLMRPHIFKWPEPFKTPRMVTSPKLMALGVGAPLHPYLKSILQWYDIAPIQLSPNYYKLALALFILYNDEGISTPPTMEEFSYFFAIRKSSKGYFFLTPQHKHNRIGFSNGKVSHEKNWKEPFFYLWNVERIRVVFNCNYNNRNTKELFGEAKKRADKILALPPSRFHLKTLISEENLKRVGILKKEVGTIIPFQRFRKGVPIKGGKDSDSDEDEEEYEDKSEKDMDGLPAGWGLEMGSAPTTRVTKRTKTRAHRKELKKPVAETAHPQTVIDLEKDKNRKRKEKPEAVITTEGASSKKLKPSSLSLVSATSSPLSIPFVSDDDVLKWKQRDPLEENEAIIKASSEMLISALNRQILLQKDRARLEALEEEKCRLSKQWP